jgi:orotate phosphoribosyltransferase
MEIIHAQGATPAAVFIALDRQERGQGELSAIQEVERDYSMPVAAITRLENLIDYLGQQADAGADLERITKYRAEYGIYKVTAVVPD